MEEKFKNKKDCCGKIEIQSFYISKAHLVNCTLPLKAYNWINKTPKILHVISSWYTAYNSAVSYN